MGSGHSKVLLGLLVYFNSSFRYGFHPCGSSSGLVLLANINSNVPSLFLGSFFDI